MPLSPLSAAWPCVPHAQNKPDWMQVSDVLSSYGVVAVGPSEGTKLPNLTRLKSTQSRTTGKGRSSEQKKKEERNLKPLLDGNCPDMPENRGPHRIPRHLPNLNPCPLIRAAKMGCEEQLLWQAGSQRMSGSVGSPGW